MGWRLRARENVNPLCPLKGCLCFDNRMGTFVGCCIILFTDVLAWILIVLDLASWGSSSFEIEGGFPAWWRAPFWKGFLTCDIIMFCVHLLIIIMACILLVAILNPEKYKIYRLRPILRAWYVILILHILNELGVSTYIYSWYGLAAWRRPYTVFTFMFYIMRFLIYILFITVSLSYGAELDLELMIPEDDKTTSHENLYEIGSKREAAESDLYDRISVAKSIEFMYA